MVAAVVVVAMVVVKLFKGIYCLRGQSGLLILGGLRVKRKGKTSRRTDRAKSGLTMGGWDAKSSQEDFPF